MYNELFKRIISSLIILPIVLFSIFNGSPYFEIIFIIFFLISIFEWHQMAKEKKYYYSGILFLFISFYMIYLTRFSLIGGDLIFLLILFICITTDIGGFIFGKFLKGPKLTKISPKKTYAGMIGSFLLPIFLLFLLLEKTKLQLFYDFSLRLIVFAILVSAVSQFGDLVISYFKRISNIKDTGKIIPGHGGILDRIDGIIFAFPFSFILISKIDVNFLI